MTQITSAEVHVGMLEARPQQTELDSSIHMLEENSIKQKKMIMVKHTHTHHTTHTHTHTHTPHTHTHTKLIMGPAEGKAVKQECVWLQSQQSSTSFFAGYCTCHIFHFDWPVSKVCMFHNEEDAFLSISINCCTHTHVSQLKTFVSVCQAAEEMVRFQLRHGNDLLAMDSLREVDVSDWSVCIQC